MRNDIKGVLREHAQLAVDVDTLAPADDLYLAGMTSHAGVNVMLALEEQFDVEFPDRLLTRSTFATIVSIEQAVSELRNDA